MLLRLRGLTNAVVTDVSTGYIVARGAEQDTLVSVEEGFMCYMIGMIYEYF